MVTAKAEFVESGTLTEKCVCPEVVRQSPDLWPKRANSAQTALIPIRPHCLLQSTLAFTLCFNALILNTAQALTEAIAPGAAYTKL